MVQGKIKGGNFEREMCKRFSLWITDGKRKDVFWRSAMSGGRATVAGKRGEANRQAGDMCAVAPEGHVLTDKYLFEFKHYKNIQLERFLLRGVGGKLTAWWARAKRDARIHNRTPILIVRGNNMPILIITPHNCPLNQYPVMHSRLNKCDIGLFDRTMAQPGGLNAGVVRFKNDASPYRLEPEK